MKVKLLSDEISEAQYNAAMNTPACDTAWDDVRAEFAAAHDAAPEDATQALERLLVAIGNWIDTPDDESLEEARGHYQKLLATETGTALIRQAEERDDG
jgi:hypothetical protein